MCLIAFALNHSPDLPLILAANRDEFLARPAAPMHWWPPQRTILAGRDLAAGGTWLGLNRNGRWAAILNRRIEGAPLPGAAKTRGELIPQWLTCDMTAADFMAALRKQLADYQFFNLVVGEAGGDTVLLTSPERRVLQLEDGIYALSNCAFDADWEKTALLRQDMTELLDRSATSPDLCGQMVSLMRGEAQHPVTSPEEDFSATRFILSAGYGTRCSTALVQTAVRMESCRRWSVSGPKAVSRCPQPRGLFPFSLPVEQRRPETPAPAPAAPADRHRA